MNSKLLLFALAGVIVVSHFSNVVAQTSQISEVLEIDDLGSGFFTDEKKRISHHAVEMGQKMNIQQTVYNNSDNSEQKGTLEVFFRSAPFDENPEHLKTFTFDIKPYAHQIFEIDYIPKKLGSFEISIEPIMTEKYSMTSVSYLFWVVEEYSKSFDKVKGCDENFRPMAKPNYSSVVCVTGETYLKLIPRGWHQL